jgi:hypothetical protein
MKHKQSPAEKLITAIHCFQNGYPLNWKQRRLLNKFHKRNDVGSMPVDWDVIKYMEGADERAKKSWEGLEKKIKEKGLYIKTDPATETESILSKLLSLLSKLFKKH